MEISLSRSFLAGVILLLSVNLFGQGKPSPWKFYNDYTGKVSSSEVEGYLDAWYKQDTTVCTVLITNDFETSIEEYGQSIGNNWGLYDVNRDAIVIVISPEKRKSTIQLSRSLEPVISDGECGQILRNARSYFKQNDINTGVLEVVTSLKTKIADKRSKGVESIQVIPVKNQEPFDPLPVIGWILGLLSIMFGVGTFLHEREKKRQEAWEKELAEEAAIRQKQYEESQRAREAYEKSPEGIAARKKKEQEAEAHRMWLLSPEGREHTRKEAEKAAREAEERRKKKEEDDKKQKECNESSSSYSSYPSSSSNYTSTPKSDTTDFSVGSFDGFGGGGGSDSW